MLKEEGLDLGESLERLRAPSDRPLESVLPSVLDQWWENSLRNVVSTELKAVLSRAHKLRSRKIVGAGAAAAEDRRTHRSHPAGSAGRRGVRLAWGSLVLRERPGKGDVGFCRSHSARSPTRHSLRLPRHHSSIPERLRRCIGRPDPRIFNSATKRSRSINTEVMSIPNKATGFLPLRRLHGSDPPGTQGCVLLPALRGYVYASQNRARTGTSCATMTKALQQRPDWGRIHLPHYSLELVGRPDDAIDGLRHAVEIGRRPGWHLCSARAIVAALRSGIETP